MNTFLKNSVPVVFRDLLSSHTIFYFRTNRCWKEHAINHTYIQNRIYYPSFHNRDWARWLIPVSQFATCCGFSLICITLTGGSVCVADTTCLSVTASVQKSLWIWLHNVFGHFSLYFVCTSRFVRNSALFSSESRLCGTCNYIPT